MKTRVAVALVLAVLALGTLRADDAEWKLTGSSTRVKKVGFIKVKVYSIEHHMKKLPDKKSKEAVIDAELDKKFTWTMLRDVEAEKIQSALKDAFALNECKDEEKIKTFLGAFKAELKEKSTVTVSYDASKKETSVTVESGSGSAKVEGVEFMKSVWKLWLGKIDQETLGDELISKIP